MIEIDKTPRFKTKDGALHMTLEDAKIHALDEILSGEESATIQILKNADAIIAILKMKPRKQRTAKPKNKPKKAEPVAK